MLPPNPCSPLMYIYFIPPALMLGLLGWQNGPNFYVCFATNFVIYGKPGCALNSK